MGYILNPCKLQVSLEVVFAPLITASQNKKKTLLQTTFLAFLALKCVLWGSILCAVRLLSFLGLEGFNKKSIRVQAEVMSNLTKAEKTPLSQIQRHLEGYNFSDNPSVTEHIGVSTFEFIYL